MTYLLATVTKAVTNVVTKAVTKAVTRFDRLSSWYWYSEMRCDGRTYIGRERQT